MSVVETCWSGGKRPSRKSIYVTSHGFGRCTIDYNMFFSLVFLIMSPFFTRDFAVFGVTGGEKARRLHDGVQILDSVKRKEGVHTPQSQE